MSFFRRLLGSVMIGAGIGLAIDTGTLSVGITLVGLAFFNVLVDLVEAIERRRADR